jgi:hypothetical protein
MGITTGMSVTIAWFMKFMTGQSEQDNQPIEELRPKPGQSDLNNPGFDKADAKGADYCS